MNIQKIIAGLCGLIAALSFSALIMMPFGCAWGGCTNRSYLVPVIIFAGSLIGLISYVINKRIHPLSLIGIVPAFILVLASITLGLIDNYASEDFANKYVRGYTVETCSSGISAVPWVENYDTRDIYFSNRCYAHFGMCEKIQGSVQTEYECKKDQGKIKTIKDCEELSKNYNYDVKYEVELCKKNL
jgi:hypothetical protein